MLLLFGARVVYILATATAATSNVSWYSALMTHICRMVSIVVAVVEADPYDLRLWNYLYYK